jgi:hypothetical protein
MKTLTRRVRNSEQRFSPVAVTRVRRKSSPLGRYPLLMSEDARALLKDADELARGDVPDLDNGS